MEPVTDDQARRLLFAVDWNGPWERIAAFCYGLRRDNTLRWEVTEGSLLDRLGTYADARNTAWRNKHITNRTTPRPRWKRQP